MVYISHEQEKSVRIVAYSFRMIFTAIKQEDTHLAISRSRVVKGTNSEHFYRGIPRLEVIGHGIITVIGIQQLTVQATDTKGQPVVERQREF